MTPMISWKKITGEMPGSVMWTNFLIVPAPSISAASYSERGTSCSAARKMIMMPPTPHTPMISRAGFVKSGSVSQFGWYRPSFCST